MIDTVKLFFANLHVLPPWLQNAFALLFFGTMIVMAFTFKRWLEMRRTSKEVDLWACVPVTPALVAACFWGLWASAGVYHVYLDDVKTAQAKEAGKSATTVAGAASAAVGAAGAAGASGAVAGKHLRAGIPPKPAPRIALPEDAARAPRPEVGGTVVNGGRTPRDLERRAVRPVRGGKAAGQAEAPAGADAAVAIETGDAQGSPRIGTAADSTAPVAPPAEMAREADEQPIEAAPAAAPQGKLARRLKNGRRGQPSQQAQAQPQAQPQAHAPAAGPVSDAAPAVAPAEAAPAKTAPAAAPAAPAAPADEGPRFKVERPADPPAAPATAP